MRDALIRLWGFELESETMTDQQGYYSLNATTKVLGCTLYAFFDDPITPGVDLLPAAHYISTNRDVEEMVNFTLIPAATIIVVGQPRLIESMREIGGYSLRVIDPSKGEVLHYDGYSLNYGTGMNSQSLRLGLSPSTVVVPAGIPFLISVSSSYQYEKRTDLRQWYGWYTARRMIEAFTEFYIVEGDKFLLREGELLRLDMRKYSLQSDLYKMEDLINTISANLTTVEESGFYLTSEREELLDVRDLMARASMKLSNASYEAAYIELRQAYLKAVELRSRLTMVTNEALFSINLLIPYVAVTAVATASLVTKNNVKRSLLSAGLYAPLILYLHFVYPGSVVVSISWFIIASILSITALLLATNFLPLIFRDRKEWRGIPRLGGIFAVISIAIRNLKRRRFRTMLIIISILALTAGFVALTSISTGFGLIYKKVSVEAPAASGILIRLPEYTPKRVIEEGWFCPFNFMIAEWASKYEGVDEIAMKAENRPEQDPWTNIDDQPIYGILGVQPDKDQFMRAIDDALVEGEPLREDGTCLISDELLRRPGVNIGDIVEIRDVPMRVVGTFGDRILEVKDFDGESILPNYQIDLTPEARRPVLSAVRCEPQSVVITTLNTALKIRYVYVSRVDAVVKPGVGVETVAKSIALSGGYRVWASSSGEVHLAYLGGSISGKGLNIFVPWVIVILNVIAAMANTMYERRQEIVILSSIGLNPVHISGVFLAEASVIGVIGGGFGYLLGMGLYPLMAGLKSAPVVNQKVSAIWCLASLCIAFTAAIIGSTIALKSSVVVTPSLKRKWVIDEIPVSHEIPWALKMPVKIKDSRVDGFVSFLTDSLKRHNSPLLSSYISALKTDIEENKTRRIYTIAFSYGDEPTDLRGLKTFNTITISKVSGGEDYSIDLLSKGTKEAIYKTGSFVREMIFTWNTKREE